MNVRHSEVARPRQPGNVTYSTSISCIVSTDAGKLGNSTPFRLYVVAILISDNSSSVSSFVKHKAVNPLISVVYLKRTRSSQPHRRLRPVVTPHSRPRVCKCSPISYEHSKNSNFFSSIFIHFLILLEKLRRQLLLYRLWQLRKYRQYISVQDQDPYKHHRHCNSMMLHTDMYRNQYRA